MTRTTPFERPLVLAGWAPGSRWGFDPGLECYWVELAPRAGSGTAVRVGPEHLITTLDGLARALARVAGAQPTEAYLALTA